MGPRDITDHPYLSHERFEQVLKVRAYGIGMGAKKWNGNLFLTFQKMCYCALIERWALVFDVITMNWTLQQ